MNNYKNKMGSYELKVKWLVMKITIDSVSDLHIYNLLINDVIPAAHIIFMYDHFMYSLPNTYI